MSIKHLRAEQLEYLEKAYGGLFVAVLFLMGNLLLEKWRRNDLEKRVEKLELSKNEELESESEE